MIVGLVLLVVGAGGAVYYGRLQDSQRTEEFKQLIADNERMRVMLQSSMRGSGDTSLVNESQRKIAALQQRLAAATTDAERDTIKAEIQENERQLRRMVAMDLPAIHKQNSGAVAIMISEIAGKSSAGSGFAITPQGLMITNRHNVKDLESGAVASRIAVKFTGTRDWLPAKVVKVSDDPDEDLALIQVERAGPFPVVAGVSSNASDASEGMSVVTIGYPLGYDTPQEGAGNDFLAKSTLNPGTVSKKTSTVLQIDSYATHGSSGSPVFSTRGFVVGIIYGGQRESAGKIVYAVPPERIAGFIPAEHKAIIRD
jgi:S1-C subfamily serine protease